jgi:hypothetical protein
MTDELGRTVILYLVPTSIRLLMNVDKDDEAQSVLLGGLKLKRRESVKLSTEEDFEKLEGSFRFVDAGDKDADDDKRIDVFVLLQRK